MITVEFNPPTNFRSSRLFNAKRYMLAFPELAQANSTNSQEYNLLKSTPLKKGTAFLYNRTPPIFKTVALTIQLRRAVNHKPENPVPVTNT